MLDLHSTPNLIQSQISTVRQSVPNNLSDRVAQIEAAYSQNQWSEACRHAGILCSYWEDEQAILLCQMLQQQRASSSTAIRS